MQMAGVPAYLISVEKHAERPWIMSMDWFVTHPGGPLVISKDEVFGV
jgi:hypothetical protein